MTVQELVSAGRIALVASVVVLFIIALALVASMIISTVAGHVNSEITRMYDSTLDAIIWVLIVMSGDKGLSLGMNAWNNRATVKGKKSA